MPGSAAPPLPASGRSRPKAISEEERAQLEAALREQDEKREDDRRKAEAERKAAKEREMQRKAKLGSAFLVDAEEEEELPEMAAALTKKAAEKRFEDRAGAMMIEYAPQAGAGGQLVRGTDPPEAARFVESMGGGSILHEAHRMLLQKAGGSDRSPSVVRKDRKKSERGRSRSRSRRRSRSRKRGRSRSRSGSAGGRQSAAGRSGPSGSYRSPTPDGRARGQARAARKAKMIASMLGVQIPRR